MTKIILPIVDVGQRYDLLVGEDMMVHHSMMRRSFLTLIPSELWVVLFQRILVFIMKCTCLCHQSPCLGISVHDGRQSFRA